jgi:hypothetical protein
MQIKNKNKVHYYQKKKTKTKRTYKNKIHNEIII